MADRRSRVAAERPVAATQPAAVAAEPAAVAAEPAAVPAEPIAVPAEPIAVPAEPIAVPAEPMTTAAVLTAEAAPSADALLVTETGSGASPAPVAGGGFAPVVVSRLAPHDAVIGYVSVPADAGPGDIAASERAIERVAERCGWQLVDVVRDPDCASLSDPEALSDLLERMADGEASALVVSDAWALCRSVDVAQLLERLDSVGAALVAIDLGVDTSTAQGRRVARALINMNGWGRRASRSSVVAAATDVRGPERWTGRLSLDPPPARTPAPAAGQVILNGTRPKARNGTGAIALNGSGATPRNGTGAIAFNGNGATAHDAEDDHGARTNGNGRPHDSTH
jgi:DNA invertase Pin-like site-specific DNA recombinase